MRQALFCHVAILTITHIRKRYLRVCSLSKIYALGAGIEITHSDGGAMCDAAGVREV
jgi:hypothetical protein